LSGHASKLDDPVARYLAIAFCYGCSLGPSQTARSLGGVDRRDLSWVNQHHITEEKLDEAIRAVIAAYNRFQLPKYWGTGKRASADGTKWEMYEQNLLAEYHIRYGGYGGIGYYHVSEYLHRALQSLYSLWGLGGLVHSGYVCQRRRITQAGNGTWRYASAEYHRVWPGAFVGHFPDAPDQELEGSQTLPS
jgi:hypothetical protein